MNSASSYKTSFSEWISDFFSMDVRRWDMREWIIVSIFTQTAGIFLFQLILNLLPEKKSEFTAPIMTSELSFVEYNEIKDEKISETQELSDEIIEKDKLTEEPPPVNWTNAADPLMDFSQRYAAKLYVNISPDDYPQRAKRANIGLVSVAVTLYIDSSGKIRDVKIRNIRSNAQAADPYKNEFISAVRKILLEKTKLMNTPYSSKGQAKDFTWDTTVSFTIQ